MKDVQLPFYARATLTLLGLSLCCLAIYLGHSIIVPLVFGLLIAVLLLPLCSKLEKLRVPRIIAIFICLLVAILVVGLVIFFIGSQLVRFADSFPALEKSLTSHLNSLHQWLESSFGISTQKQIAWTNTKLTELYASSGAYITSTVSALTNILVLVGLLPVYIFLFLYYRRLLVEFVVRVFARQDSRRVRGILGEVREVMHSYITGLLIEATIVAVLNSIGLLIIGLDYAILIGVIAALLNVVPYVGGLVAILLAVVMGFVTSDNALYPLLVTGVLLVVQFIDNNILVPRIVAGIVSLNALVSVVAVLIGAALCGVAGMFLAIPLTAILKIIFDRIEGLKAWGLLLGDKIPGEENVRLNS
jgi:predicted PurR-regulated permease PerM